MPSSPPGGFGLEPTPSLLSAAPTTDAIDFSSSLGAGWSTVHIPPPATVESGHQPSYASAREASWRGYAIAKRSIDIVISALALLALAPLFLILAIVIKMDSQGTVFYSQTRCGKDGVPFSCHKFRTMVANADALLMTDAALQASFSQQWKLANDPRVTSVGRFLRKSSLDELPQLWNVLRGEMSLVGPRPVQYAEIRDFYKDSAGSVTCVRPGMTGLWQISGRSSVSYDERVALDVEYVQHRTFRYDMMILLRTLPAILMSRGAC